MGLENLKPGVDLPYDINVVIEIASNSRPIKYELDKTTGLITVDRFLGTAMFYPCEYGFIPHTLSEDGDPEDVLVVSPYALVPGCVIRCRPVGMLHMTDESGKDTKILAVPISKLTPCYQHVEKPQDLGNELLAMIEHFFKHYKDLEEGKWTKIEGWAGKQLAEEEILASIERYQKSITGDRVVGGKR